MSMVTGQRLQDRYTISRMLGEGGSGQSYLAQTDDGQQVAIKTLHLGQVEDWKFIEMFERQFEALQHLQHPSIPRVFAMFSEVVDQIPRQFLVQEYIDGENVKAVLQSGQRFTEDKARRLLVEMLDILEYLHSFSPPILHRDIKPSNIILRAEDQSAVLIDFDTARLNVIDASMADGTMVGTAGYVPLEQLSGRPQPSSDLYALGMTLIRALSGKDPTELPVEAMRTQFRPFLNVSENLLDTIEVMVEPDITRRVQSVADVRAALMGKRDTALTTHVSDTMLTAPSADEFAVGQEVMVPARLIDSFGARESSYNLCTVIGEAERPTHLMVESEEGKRAEVQRKSLIAVTQEEIGPRTQVYWRDTFGWELTWTASVRGRSATVKSAHESFQSDVFNKKVDLIDLRQPLDPQQRSQRSRSEALLVKFNPTSEPINLIFLLGVFGVFGFVLLVFIQELLM
ncbi:MAG: serine/threonine-protein kinase [Myxococcota bacterium]|nr:serine/threonine-protein kinase [Myxococcota bacterium]